MGKKQNLRACSPKPSLVRRLLIDRNSAKELAGIFSLLANDTRLQMLHAIMKGRELCVGDIASAVGMKPQAVSNQLQKLTDKSVLNSERRGNQIFYSVVDPCIVELLDRGLCLSEDSQKRHG